MTPDALNRSAFPLAGVGPCQDFALSEKARPSSRAAPLLLLVGFGLVNVRRLRRGGCAFVAAHSSSFPSLLFPSDSIQFDLLPAATKKLIWQTEGKKALKFPPAQAQSSSSRTACFRCIIYTHNIFFLPLQIFPIAHPTSEQQNEDPDDQPRPPRIRPGGVDDDDDDDTPRPGRQAGLPHAPPIQICQRRCRR